jgi:carbonic anhydrase
MTRTVSVILGFSLLLVTGCGPGGQDHRGAASSDITTKEEQQALTPDDVMADLRAGNQRFVAGSLTSRDYLAQMKATASGQYPKAVVLSCLDSRVPVEIVLDQGIGDLFVGRVAGNIDDDVMIGSFEFATAVAGAKLLLVLGHSECGAVKGSIDRKAVKSLQLDKLNHLLDDINPAVEAALQPGDERTSANKDLVTRAIRENVRMTIERIRQKSPDLVALEQAGKIKIVGGIYDLASGKIGWM